MEQFATTLFMCKFNFAHNKEVSIIINKYIDIDKCYRYYYPAKLHGISPDTLANGRGPSELKIRVYSARLNNKTRYLQGKL